MSDAVSQETGLAAAACISDLRAIARRRFPSFAFDLVDGGAANESNLRRNEDALQAIRLTPRYLVDASRPRLATETFGQTCKAPFGIAPIGMLNVLWPGAGLALARLAATHDVPYCASAAALRRTSSAWPTRRRGAAGQARRRQRRHNTDPSLRPEPSADELSVAGSMSVSK